MENKFRKMLNINKGKSVKMNYEDLKKALGYEDFFYEMVIKPISKEYGFKTSFDGGFLVLKTDGGN